MLPTHVQHTKDYVQDQSEANLVMTCDLLCECSREPVGVLLVDLGILMFT